MPTYTLPASADIVEALVGLYRSVVPQDMGRPDRVDNSDDAYVLAEMMAISDCTIRNWNRMGIVSYADKAYLELQARQVGLFKQATEADDTLRSRIQTPPLAITPDLILQAIQQIVDANGGGSVFMIELPRDSMFFDRGDMLDNAELGGGTLIIVRIPASVNCLAACTDALRSKRAAGKAYLVQEYINI